MANTQNHSPNKHAVSWHGGLGYEQLSNGDRRTQFLGVVHIVQRGSTGWTLTGQAFKTLADVSKHINHLQG